MLESPASELEARPAASCAPDFAADDSSVRDFFNLLKPRVMSLVVFTGFVGMVLAPGFSTLHPFLIAVILLALAAGAGASGAFNMWYDRDIDALMERTKTRPLPMGRILPDDALGFAIFVSLFSVTAMGLTANWLAAGLLAFASFFYVMIYTMGLKRRTPQNIVIGGAAGAFPPLIGWVAVTGNISLEPVILFLIIFFWTPPHFWALALFSCKDYQKANIPMMPAVVGERATKIQMVLYTFLLFPLTLVPFFLGMAGVVYLITAIALSGFFVYTSLKVYYDDGDKNARLMFFYSVFYLFALFSGLLFDALH